MKWVLAAVVLTAALPLVAGCYQCLLASLHVFRRHDPDVPEGSGLLRGDLVTSVAT